MSTVGARRRESEPESEPEPRVEEGSPDRDLARHDVLRRELGDEEFAARMQAILDEHEEVAESNGASKYAGASAFTNLYANLARFSRPSAMRDLLTFGTPASWKSGSFVWPMRSITNSDFGA